MLSLSERKTARGEVYSSLRDGRYCFMIEDIGFDSRLSPCHIPIFLLSLCQHREPSLVFTV